MKATSFKRKTKLIKPSVQLRMIGSFVGLSALALFMQFLFLGGRLSFAASNMEGPGGELVAEVPRMLLEVFAFSVLVLIPVIFGFGIILTFRVAGPIYRFESYLKSVAKGEQVGPCTIRKHDELQSLCDVINEVTEPLRMQKRGDEAEVEPASETRAAA